MNDNPLAEASIAAAQWAELAAAPAPDVVARLADAARRHHVTVSVIFSPYDTPGDESD